jgi:hypothetical protein
MEAPGTHVAGPQHRTIAALIARNQTIEMPYYFNVALDNGVKPREISEIVTHLAFYSGWANAMAAVAVTKGVFADRKIGADQLPRLHLRFFRSTTTRRQNAQRPSIREAYLVSVGVLDDEPVQGPGPAGDNPEADRPAVILDKQTVTLKTLLLQKPLGDL